MAMGNVTFNELNEILRQLRYQIETNISSSSDSIVKDITVSNSKVLVEFNNGKPNLEFPISNLTGDILDILNDVWIDDDENIYYKDKMLNQIDTTIDDVEFPWTD